MKYWNNKYPNKIYNLDYEKLTRNTSQEIRKLLKYCELNIEKECFKPHLNKRSISTASSIQAREKIYKGSSNAWHKYEPYLKGAFNSLTSKETALAL